MRKYSLFHPFILSFFSRDLYIDVGRHWRGYSVVFLAVLAAVEAVPGVLRVHFSFGEFIESESPALTGQIPAFRLSGGELVLDAPQPYYIRGLDDTPIIILDSTGEVSSLDGQEAAMLLTRTEMFTRSGTNRSNVYPLSSFGEQSIDGARVQGWLDMTARWLAVFIYPFAAAFWFVLRLVQAAFYGLIGMVFARIADANLGFGALYSLAIVALTPAVMLSMAADLGSVEIPNAWLFGFVTAMVYLFFAVKASADAPTPDYDPTARV